MHNWQKLSIFAPFIKKDFEVFPVCDKWGKPFLMKNLNLLPLLSLQDIAVLNTIQEIVRRIETDTTEINPAFTLQQNYLGTLLQMSQHTVIKCIGTLCELGVISPVSKGRGECAVYRYNPDTFRKLYNSAIRKKYMLRTGYQKRPQELTRNGIIDYMVGKSICKNGYEPRHHSQSRAGRQK